jgi:hypothetical protein
VEGVSVWIISSSFIAEFGFLFVFDEGFGFLVGMVGKGLVFWAALFALLLH